MSAVLYCRALGLALTVASSACHEDRILAEVVDSSLSRLCGGAPCDGWCERPLGACDSPASQGICRPHVVQQEERSALLASCANPPQGIACGCDGRSFANDCYRRLEEVSGFSTGGRCASRLACLATTDCGAEEFCDFAVCNSQGAGRCQPGGPAAAALQCDPDSGPVCGCDGKTYASECLRHRAGVSKARGGPC